MAQAAVQMFVAFLLQMVVGVIVVVVSTLVLLDAHTVHCCC